MSDWVPMTLRMGLRLAWADSSAKAVTQPGILRAPNETCTRLPTSTLSSNSGGIR